MIKTFQSLIRFLVVILSVWNFEFRSFVFVCDLYFGAWNFHDLHMRLNLFQAITCLNGAGLRWFQIYVRVLMQNKKTNLYSQAHLMVAAIRVYEHLNSRPPTVDDVCRVINFSVEQGYFICRKLQEIDIIKAVEGSYGTRLFINDHLKLEDLPRGEPENKLEDDLKKFQDTQKAFSRKIESFQAQQKQKKKDLFAEMEKKLKEELEKK